jgi:hypothetical protein
LRDGNICIGGRLDYFAEVKYLGGTAKKRPMERNGWTKTLLICGLIAGPLFTAGRIEEDS